MLDATLRWSGRRRAVLKSLEAVGVDKGQQASVLRHLGDTVTWKRLKRRIARPDQRNSTCMEPRCFTRLLVAPTSSVKMYLIGGSAKDTFSAFELPSSLMCFGSQVM